MKNVHLSSYNNDWFRKEIGASRMKQALWYIFNVLFFINPLVASSALKVFLLRLFGAQIGKNVTIKPGVNIKYPWKLAIGNHTWIGEKVWIDNLATVTIADNVCISQGAMLLTGNHNFSTITFDLHVAPVVIAAGTWIGAKSVVCPGVTAHSHSMLTVNSVANKDMEAYTIYQGNPAVKIKDRVIA